MGLFFRKSIKLGKHTRINLSKSGIGVSTGVKGARVGIGPKGIRKTLSIPGTGISYVEQNSLNDLSGQNNLLNATNKPPNGNMKNKKGGCGCLSIIVAIIFIIIIGKACSNDKPTVANNKTATTVESKQPVEQPKIQENPVVQPTNPAPVPEIAPAVVPVPVPTPSPAPAPVPVTPADNNSNDTVVYSTKSGECYHMDGCHSLKKSKIKTTVKDANAAGLRPCKKCNPPQ